MFGAFRSVLLPFAGAHLVLLRSSAVTPTPAAPQTEATRTTAAQWATIYFPTGGSAKSAWFFWYPFSGSLELFFVIYH
ncbi:hypothetical protein BDV93DRAFT_524640 [Ceratobasidium sp. AG-I]|nr:hypothetical protein BDV93DRAFT_524640 [Ceratobasidium sp. AG-I]